MHRSKLATETLAGSNVKLEQAGISEWSISENGKNALYRYKHYDVHLCWYMSVLC